MMQNIFEDEHSDFLKDIQQQEKITRDFCIRMLSLYTPDSSLAGEWEYMDIRVLIVVTIQTLEAISHHKKEGNDECGEIGCLVRNVLSQIRKNFDIAAEVV